MISYLNPANWLQIEKKQRERIAVSWLVNFLYRFSFMLGWTAITAIFVHRIGIESLPFLFIGNALLVMFGTMIFSEIVRFIKREVLIAFSLVMASGILLVSIQMLLPRSEIAFLIGCVTGISLFLGQVGILMQLFIEDMFTPLESESAFPLIETAEVIGGIMAGLVLTTFGSSISPYKFLYVIIIISLLIIPTINHFKENNRNDLPTLNLKKKKNLRDISKFERIEEGWQEVKRTGFLQGIVVVILCQFIIFNLVEFQYTKAVQQQVYHVQEATIAYNLDAPIHLSSSELIDSKHSMTVSESTFEKELAHTLGLFQMIFSIFALITQIFLASKVIKRLGIIQSLLVHPLLMILNLCFMTMRFNITSAAITKTGFEMTRTIFQSSYLSSYYSLKEEAREEIKEFIEGIIVPLGAIIGTMCIFLFEGLLTGSHMTLAINLTLVAMAIVMAHVIYNLQQEYTKVSERTLESIQTTSDKLNAVEILSQKGHADAWKILVRALERPLEKTSVKVAVLKALGKMQKEKALPYIVQELDSGNPKIEIAAIQAIGQYNYVYFGAYENAFTQYELTKKLRTLFEKTENLAIKKAIITTFAHIDKVGMAKYLTKMIKKGKNHEKKDALQIIKMLKDPQIENLVEGQVKSRDIGVKCSAIEVLSHLPNNKKRPETEIDKLIKKVKPHHPDFKYIIQLIGNIKAKKYEKLLRKYTEKLDPRLRESALIGLIKLGNKEAINECVEMVVTRNESSEQLKKLMHDNEVPLSLQKIITRTLHRKVNEEINAILIENKGRVIGEFTLEELHTLQFLYDLIDKDREVLKVSEIIEKKYKKRPRKQKLTTI